MPMESCVVVVVVVVMCPSMCAKMVLFGLFSGRSSWKLRTIAGLLNRRFHSGPLFFHNHWTIKELQMGAEEVVFHTAVSLHSPFGVKNGRF